MDSPGRFNELDELAVEKARLNALRHHHSVRLERHWAALKDSDVRGVLLRDAASDMVLSWRPARLLAGLLGGGTLTSALGSAIFRRGGLTKRMLAFATSLIVPQLLERAGSLSVDAILQEVGKTMDRIRERMVEREMDRAAREED